MVSDFRKSVWSVPSISVAVLELLYMGPALLLSNLWWKYTCRRHHIVILVTQSCGSILLQNNLIPSLFFQSISYANFYLQLLTFIIGSLKWFCNKEIKSNHGLTIIYFYMKPFSWPILHFYLCGIKMLLVNEISNIWQ